MSSTDLDPNISINALIVSPDAVDEVTAAVAQEQPRADKVAAVAFLSDLAPDATTWTFQTFDDNADRKAGHLARTLNGSLDEHWDALCRASDAGAGVFVTVNETNGNGRKAEDITRVRALFVDTDGAEVTPIKKHEPDILVESSPGNFHAHWLTNGIPLEDFRDAQKRLIAAFGTDKGVHDLPRVLRLPGFPHQKVDKKKGLKGTPFPVLYEVRGSPRPPPIGPRDADQTQALLEAINGGASAPRDLKVAIRDCTPRDGETPPPLGLSSTEVSDILALIPAAGLDYAEWFKVGAALHHEGAPLETWLAWSEPDPRYSRSVCAAKWKDFGNYRGQSATMRSVIKLSGWTGAAAREVADDIQKRLETIFQQLIDKPYDPKGDDIMGGLADKSSTKEDAEAPPEADAEAEKAEPLAPEEAVRRHVVSATIETSFYCTGAGRPFQFLNREGDLVQFSERDAWRYLTSTFGSPLKAEHIDQWVELAEPNVRKDVRKAIAAAVREPILDEIKLYRQRSALAWRVDMFAQTPLFELREFDVQITLPHRPLPQGPFEQRFIDDFRAHWPEVDLVLAFIAAARFAGDRKKAFLWWLAQSDFGKGLFMSQLAAAGVVATTSIKEIEAAMEGKPVALAADNFKRALVLWIDEFKVVKSELKQLQNEITLSPKYELRQTVEIFSKIFTSAETVNSLVGSNGVEGQFVNRMSVIENAGSIDSRPLFQANRATYAMSLRNWIATTLNAAIANYQDMGRDRATNVADKALESFHAEWGIGKRFGNLDDNIKAVADEFVEYLCRDRGQEVVELAVGGFTVSRPMKKLVDWLSVNYADSEFYTLKRKASEILVLACHEGKPTRLRKSVDGKPVRGLVLPPKWEPTTWNV